MKVAVIDTGVAVSHRDLAGKVVAFRDYIGGRTTSYDDHGHGTHVAATIAGSGAGDPAHAGAAPAATLLAAKVLDAQGSGSMSNTTAAIEWAVTQGARVINLSLGTSGCSDGSDATSRAVDNAAAQGILVAVAAGNAGPGSCTIGSPGAAGGALTVAAMADLAHRGYNLADFSSRGRPGATGTALKPDVAAPGVGIVSADAFSTSSYKTMSGTSMATPFVAAVGALMLDSGVAAADLKPRIQSAAADWGTAGDDIEFGSGRLDAFRAITGAGDPTARPVHAFRQGSLAATGAEVQYQINAADTGFPVTAMLVHTGVKAARATTPDFDLYLYDPSGREVARAETTSRQETVSVLPAAAGDYRLRVRSYSGPGNFQLDWSAGSSAAPTALSTTIAPRSVSPAGDPRTLGADDDRFYTLASTTSGTRRTTWVATFANVPADISALTVTYTGKNSVSCNQKLSLRKASGIWVQTYSGSVGPAEATVATGPPDAAGEYVAGGVFKVRVECATSVNFTTYAELLTLRYDRPAA
ncbi:MAG: S8 family serine peptidase [Acidimicrobiales bacterium]